MKLIYSICSIIFLSLLTSQAYSESPYLILGLGNSWSETDETDFEGSDTEVYVGLGYEFAPSFSVEAKYNDFGEHCDGPCAEANSFSVGTIGAVPVGESGGAFQGIIGVDFWAVDRFFFEEDGTSIFAGVGYSHKINEDISALVQFQVRTWEGDVDEYYINSLSAAIAIRL